MKLIITRELDISTFRSSVSDGFGLTIHSTNYDLSRDKFVKLGGGFKEYLNILGL